MKKTVLIKLSGESLSGVYGHGFDFPYMKRVCTRIKEIHDMGVNIGIVDERSLSCRNFFKLYNTSSALSNAITGIIIYMMTKNEKK